jgi:hypothetical protein
MYRRKLLTGSASLAAYSALSKKALAGSRSPPYSFAGSVDAINQELKRRARAAERNNPLTSGTYSGATATWAASGTLTQQWTVSNSASAFNVSSGALQIDSAGTGRFVGPWISPTSGTLSAIAPFNVNTDPRFYFSSNFPRVAFRTSATTMEMHGSWSDALSNFSVKANGQYVTPPGGLNPTTQGVMTISFTDGRKSRVIEIAGAGVWGFRGIYTTSLLDDVVSPGPQGPLWVFDGDSFTQGGGLSTPVDPDAPWYIQGAMLLGVDNYYPTAVSSTGYFSRGNPFPGGTISTLRQRLQGAGWAFVPPNPAVIVPAAGYNDMTYVIAGNITQQQLVDECVLTWKAYRQVYPNALITPLGPWDGARGPDAQTIAAELAMQTALNAIGDSRMKFIPVCTATPKPWTYGTGRTNNLVGNGNDDWATGPAVPHPIDAGHAWIGQCFAAEMRRIIYSL